MDAKAQDARSDLIQLAAKMAQQGCGISDDGDDHRPKRPRGYWLREIQRANDLARARAQMIADIANRLAAADVKKLES